MAPPDARSPTSSGRAFVTTHWSIVWRARENNSAEADAAREYLCRTYWPPIYAYLRRAGHGVQDAQDLTQEFLLRFLEKQWLNHLQDQRGRFRGFLMTFLKNFRRRYAQCLREEIAQTVLELAEAGEKLRHLLRFFAR